MTMSPRAHRRAAAAAFAVAALLAAMMLPGRDAGAADEPSTGVTQERTVSRAHLVDGAESPVETKTISMTVSQTEDLRPGQQIRISWAGAHATGGIVADPNASSAASQEYPMLIIQCRGVDTAESPLTPRTCWTQTPSERFSADNGTGFAPWRVDRSAAAADRTAHPGRPDPVPAKCFDFSVASVWIPFDAAEGSDGSAGVSYAGGPGGCAGAPPEASAVQATPANTTYAVTNTSGEGSTRFEAWDSSINQSLGCSTTVPCSLVAVPIMGVSCDVAAALLPEEDRPATAAAVPDSGFTVGDVADECTATGNFAPGAINAQPNTGYDAAVSGSLWWSASNWNNRISFPLSFASSGDVCAVTGNGSEPTLLYGSPLFAAASQQWAPAFCTDPARFTFRHIQYSEPQSLSLLAARKPGDTDGVTTALISNPAIDGYDTPTVNAPVAISGFSISYIMDSADKNQYTNLRMTPRLLAKLLTGSYPAIRDVAARSPGLSKNPMNLTLDPEFLALNPDVPRDIPAGIAASTLYLLSSDSDVITALTSYITADREARAWLDGDADPWGMVVNPPYQGILLPVASWPLIDTYDLKDPAQPGVIPTFGGCPVTSPWHNLVSAPTQSLRTIATAVEFGLPQSQVVCSETRDLDGNVVVQRFVSGGRQQQGFRFMLGITSLADAELYQLNEAALQTFSTITDYTEPFSDGEARSFAGPSQAALRAAAANLVPEAGAATTGKTAGASWATDYQALNGESAAAAAYPGLMVIYAAVPTTGLKAESAAHLAQLLRFAATDGQTPGFGNGQLPPGYLPMTADNGAGDLAAYTVRAADAVEAQTGQVPPLVAVPAPVPSSSAPIPPAPATPATAPGPPPRATASLPATTPAAPAGATAAPSTSVATVPVSQRTPKQPKTLISIALPALVGTALLSGLVSAGLSVLPRLRRR